MAADVDKPAILASYAATRALLDTAAARGRALAGRIDRIYLVGCGGPNRAMLPIEYWIEHFSAAIEVRRYFPAEFIRLNPRRLDARTLVILGSKSGTTPETVAAAEFVRDRGCPAIAITEKAASPLAQALPDPLLTGAGSGNGAMLMLLLALAGGVLAERDGWDLFDPLMDGLHRLPQILADVSAASDRRSAEDARLLKDDRFLYHVAAGPMFGCAYVWGVCVLMEMQWMHSVALEAAEFFHGPFEIVDPATPIVILKGEDPTRPLMERVERFCKRYTERLFIYDTLEWEMPGIDPRIRPLVGPQVLQSALRRVSDRLAIWHNHPLSTRRYMGKVDY